MIAHNFNDYTMFLVSENKEEQVEILSDIWVCCKVKMEAIYREYS